MLMNIDELLKLTAGFFLTTVCGGILGYLFQRQHARYQWLRSRRETEIKEAQAVFEEVSRILDRRLYRSRQLLWSMERSADVRNQRLADYRDVVTEWNDNINRILAVLAIHFSDEIRNAIDNDIGAKFVAVGRSMESAIRGETMADTKVAGDLDELAARIYGFNVRLLKEIRSRRKSLYEER
jgi:hypothetical protein